MQRAKARRIIRAIVAASMVAIALVSAAASTVKSTVRHGAPDRQRHLLKGIDVSHYQGMIDWRAVASHGVAFAYVKATEGVDGRDALFARNWRDARRAGVRVGAYHYFIFCRSARAQAWNFLAAAPQPADSLAPAVDLEAARSCAVPLTGPKMRRELGEFLAIVEARQGRRAVLYVTPRFFAAYKKYLPQRAMWRRSIRLNPAPMGSWTFWQYKLGRVAGIRTRVDLNVSVGGAHARDRL